jgi:YD repeat-containing protein
MDDLPSTFHYDATRGNRDGKQALRDDPGAPRVNFVVDDDTNRYTSIGGNSITHDDAGNLTADKDGYTYEYDYENRVVRIEDSSSNDVAEYAYDALGRRIRVIDSKASTTTLYYYNPQWQVLAEYDNANNLQRYFIYGNYIDPGAPGLVMNDGTDDYYYAGDHLYGTVALIGYVDSAWTVVERYEYDAYGKMTRLDGDFTTWSGTEAGNPYYFTGRRLDIIDNGSLMPFEGSILE